MIVRTFEEDFTGPTTLVFWLGFFWMNDEYEDAPRYVPSAEGTSVDMGGFGLDEEFSSYQVEDFVASSRLEREAMVLEVGAASGAGRDLIFEAEEAVTPAFFLRRLICLPSSSSDEVKPESESEAAGGVISRFLMLDLAFSVRFLNDTTGASTAA